ncbi:hypothetical protein F5B22DRAFT_225808 [Xylaria bambusicola]|uniref:uncharacterized protein n=1 Tax=Xylaria bambusicola TaxID=326684 RepID=UPI002007A6F8|nr:uncharacterized protein F5B22DRAFT_225808 [Xylaria bambusicola]KAI0514641.1 hypothetical protein F5B22DRAFT_225808 [Xylaria bambusicola]
MAQVSRWHYRQRDGLVSVYQSHFDSVMFFLSVFAGLWPSRNERMKFSWQVNTWPLMNFDCFYLQVHFRYFTTDKQEEDPGVPSASTHVLRCFREQGQIVSTALQVDSHSFQERRISVFGLFLAQNKINTSAAPFYSVLALGETDFENLQGYDLKWCAGLEGTITFQLAVLASVAIWTTEWNAMLDQIDKCVHVKFSHTLSPEDINAWMFDDNFERSRLYFTILQVLRMFNECISTVSDDLRALDELFLKQTDFPMQDMREDELEIMRSNWETVKKTQEEAAKALLNRILFKTEEVKSLRDGLFNASALREANKSSTMGRYVLIFTIVTVLFLPPSFVSTVFALEIFQKNVAQTKWEYKVALVSVSLVTYAVSFAAVIAVDKKKLEQRVSQWKKSFKKWTSNEAKSVPKSQDEEEPVPPVRDEESLSLKEKRHLFPISTFASRFGKSSKRKDKGKAPDNSTSSMMQTQNEQDS